MVEVKLLYTKYLKSTVRKSLDKRDRPENVWAKNNTHKWKKLIKSEVFGIQPQCFVSSDNNYEGYELEAPISRLQIIILFQVLSIMNLQYDYWLMQSMVYLRTECKKIPNDQ